MSPSRHPQTDDSTGIMNCMVKKYLRFYWSYHQGDWDEPLSRAEFAYNSAKSEDLGMVPFEVYLGWNPKHHWIYFAVRVKLMKQYLI